MLPLRFGKVSSHLHTSLLRMGILVEEISSSTGLSMGPATTCPGTLALVLLVRGHIEREEHQHMNVCICIVENTWKCTHSCTGAIADGTLFRVLLNLLWAPLIITPTDILKIHLYKYVQTNHLLSQLPDAETILAIVCPYVSVADSLTTFNIATSDRPDSIAHIFTRRFCMCIAPKIFWKKPMGLEEEQNNKNNALIHVCFFSVGLYTKVVTLFLLIYL